MPGRPAPRRTPDSGDLYPAEEHAVQLARMDMHDNRTKTCFDLLTHFKSFVVHKSGARLSR